MCECKCERKLKSISNSQIAAIVERAESVIYYSGSNNRANNKQTLENAIRHTLQLVDARLDPGYN